MINVSPGPPRPQSAAVRAPLTITDLMLYLHLATTAQRDSTLAKLGSTISLAL
jgi:hypothetical protein